MWFCLPRRSSRTMSIRQDPVAESAQAETGRLVQSPGRCAPLEQRCQALSKFSLTGRDELTARTGSSLAPRRRVRSAGQGCRWRPGCSETASESWLSLKGHIRVADGRVFDERESEHVSKWMASRRNALEAAASQAEAGRGGGLSAGHTWFRSDSEANGCWAWPAGPPTKATTAIQGSKVGCVVRLLEGRCVAGPSRRCAEGPLPLAWGLCTAVSSGATSFGL